MSAERLWRRALALAVLALFWQGLALWCDTPQFPPFSEALRALREAILSEDQLLAYARETSLALALGFAGGVLGAAALLTVAYVAPFGEAVLEALLAVFTVLPAVALFPFAVLWLGTSLRSEVALTGFAVLIPLAASAHRGIREVSPTLTLVARNLGLRGPSLLIRVLLPAALPAILPGLRRAFGSGLGALIAAELLEGAASGGLGWFLQLQKQNFEIATMFAGLLAILALAVVFESLFQALEALTVRRWKM